MNHKKMKNHKNEKFKINEKWYFTWAIRHRTVSSIQI